jgi:hypothetical protein
MYQFWRTVHHPRKVKFNGQRVNQKLQNETYARRADHDFKLRLRLCWNFYNAIKCRQLRTMWPQMRLQCSCGEWRPQISLYCRLQFKIMAPTLQIKSVSETNRTLTLVITINSFSKISIYMSVPMSISYLVSMSSKEWLKFVFNNSKYNNITKIKIHNKTNHLK